MPTPGMLEADPDVDQFPLLPFEPDREIEHLILLGSSGGGATPSDKHSFKVPRLIRQAEKDVAPFLFARS